MQYHIYVLFVYVSQGVFLVILHVLFCSFELCVQYGSKALALCDSIEDFPDTGRCALYCTLAIAYTQMVKFDIAMKYFSLAKTLVPIPTHVSEGYHSTHNVGRFYGWMGAAYQMNGQFSDALLHYNQVTQSRTINTTTTGTYDVRASVCTSICAPVCSFYALVDRA